MTGRIIAIVSAALVGGILVGVIVMAAVMRPAQPSPAASLAAAQAGGLQPRAESLGGNGLLMTFRGAYEEGVGYSAGDVVTFKGAAYVAGGDTKEAPPTDPWTLLALQDAATVEGPAGPAGAQGAQGPKGDRGDPGPAPAPWGGGWQMVEAAVTVPSGSPATFYTARAVCPTSKAIVTGGWYQTGSAAGLGMVESLVKGAGATNPLGGSYRATFTNTSGSTAFVTVYAICVTP